MFKKPKADTTHVKKAKEPLEKLKSNVREYNQQLGRESVKLGLLDDKIIAAICTPLMQRVHEMWPCSSELVFLTSSVCMNKENHRIYVLMTYSPAGGMPLGSFITPSDTQESIEGGLQLLLSLVDKPFNGNLAPALFVLEETIPERAAIYSVFRQHGVMLCPLSVLQTVWHWLHEHKSNNYADLDHSSTMEVMKQLLHTLPSRNVERFSRELLSQKRGNYTLFNYIAHLYNRKDEWCLSMKPSNASIKAKSSKSVVQAPFKMMRENTFPKLSEYNFTQLVDYVVTSWNNSYEQRLVDVANNRCEPHMPKSKVALSNGGISKDGVNKVRTSAHEHVYVCMYMYICTSVCIVCIYVCMYIRMYCMHVYACMCCRG